MEIIHNMKRAAAYSILALSTIALAGTKEANAQSVADRTSCLSTSDIDCDGIRNDYDQRILTADPRDIDKDGIINDIDRNIYVAGPPDADYDKIANALDSQPYMPIFYNPNDINRNSCAQTDDPDCDGIYTISDRFPTIPEIIDADSDGTPNAQDRHPYIPYAATHLLYDRVIDLSFVCIENNDADCDGINNAIDPDDFVADFPDVDGDNIINQYDQYPYFNAEAAKKAGGVSVVPLEPSGRFHFPMYLTTDGSYFVYKSINDMWNRDADKDGLKDALDTHPYTRDWDNDGKDDGYDKDVNVNEEKMERKYQEEKRLENKRVEARQEEQRQEKQRQTKKIEEQSADRKAEEKRQEEQRQQRKMDDQRQQEKRLAEQAERDRQQRQRDEDRRRQHP